MPGLAMPDRRRTMMVLAAQAARTAAPTTSIKALINGFWSSKEQGPAAVLSKEMRRLIVQLMRRERERDRVRDRPTKRKLRISRIQSAPVPLTASKLERT